MFEKLKKRWNIESNLQLVLILIVFSITGSASAWVSKPFVEWLGLSRDDMPGWLFTVLRLILIFPIYNVLLILIGTIFGQFRFFWNFEKKMFLRFFTKKNRTKEAGITSQIQDWNKCIQKENPHKMLLSWNGVMMKRISPGKIKKRLEPRLWIGSE